VNDATSFRKSMSGSNGAAFGLIGLRFMQTIWGDSRSAVR
jgi:hypothetical protein